MTAFWNRVIRVTVGTLPISGPRIEIDLKKTVSGEPEGSISIFNLSRDREQQVQERARGVTVAAGYGDAHAVILIGASGAVTRSWKNQNRITKVTVASIVAAQEQDGRLPDSDILNVDFGDDFGDVRPTPQSVAPITLPEDRITGPVAAPQGLPATQGGPRPGAFELALMREPALLATVLRGRSRVYLAKTPVRRIAQDISTDIGFKIADISPIPVAASATNYAVSGIGYAALKRLLEPFGISVSAEGRTFLLSSEGNVSTGVPTHFISPETGLIRQPTLTDDGAEIQTLMLPQVQLGDLVQLETRTAARGTWKVVGIHYKGSNWTPGPFGCTFDLRPAPGVRSNAELQEEHYDRLRGQIASGVLDAADFQGVPL